MKRSTSQNSAAPKSAGKSPAKKRSRADQAAVKRMMLLLKTGADTRIRKVKRVRASVRTRSYENELKLTVAMERMMGDF